MDIQANAIGNLDIKCHDFYEPIGGICLFFVIISQVTYHQAASTCKAFGGGHLAVIDDPENLKLIIDAIKVKGLEDNDFWIDGSNSEGNWTYTNGEQFVQGTPFWAASENFNKPDGDGTACAALTFNYDYLISDEPCAEVYTPICQSEVTTSITRDIKTEVKNEVICPPFFVEVSGLCLGFLTWAEEPWIESRLTCESIGGTLLGINNIKLLRSIYEYLHEQEIDTHSFWLGGTDRVKEGSWTWEGGIPITMGPPFWGNKNHKNVSDYDLELDPSGLEEPEDGMELSDLLEELVEPDGGTKENCLALTAAGMHYFRDKDCSQKLNPLCLAMPLK